MNQDFPAKFLISFDKYLRFYDRLAEEGTPYQQEKARRILKAQAPYPELREGFTEVEKLETHREILDVILQDAFSEVLSHNEIKALSLPYVDVLSHPSKRLQKILEAAGKDFSPILMSRTEGQDYIMTCTVILNNFYGYKLDFSRPYFFEFPDANGVKRHYRILYNADFMEILPNGEAPEISQDDVDEMLSRPEDLEYWKSIIPPESFIIKGFVIANMFDVTSEYSISAIKSELIASDKRGSDKFMGELQDTFRSFFRLNDLKVGFITYNRKDGQFEKVYGKGMDSFILGDAAASKCNKCLCEKSYDRLLRQKAYYVIPDVEKYQKLSKGQGFYNNLYEQGIRSAIFAPIADQDEVLGLLEVVSSEPNALNGVNATKLDDVMPFIVSAVVRSKIEEENLIDAIIQHECTTVHESVLWRFQEEAKKFIIDQLEGNDPAFKEIAFQDVHPLYGQIDIRDSSRARNSAIQRDLMIQLSRIRSVLEIAFEKTELPIYEELIYRVNNHMEDIKEVLHTNSEQAIFNFVQDEILPVFEHLKGVDKQLGAEILSYEAGIDMGTQSYYDHRRNYDETVMRINKSLASVLDRRQEDAQKMFPHYFERYKTDGVEHNMYIGDSIAAERDFDPLYLSNLRLWQLQVMCEMENAYYDFKAELPVQLDVASLILVYNTSLSIRFRMDEKRFDVDGTYNARYEVIKKRIDKSKIKGSDERLTRSGKLVIVYSQKKDELEYLRYIRFLKSKGYFTDDIEIVELEGLQGVSGLKAIRAGILYRKPSGNEEGSKEFYNYDDLMEELQT
ncbi:MULTISPECIES: GAF domain-containing protein [unclassified Robiginitalea]|uniref:GAF domain-containing protein n=1 Tax=Robiginitalea TaxID=252306 RepID=UPI00234A7BF8|nr:MULTISPECIES: GAF domain-containing protein [unclassified Robiginitalea]MDC6352862.1 GAF domain-containing protein [Robiginitalea sp. PM2]MDC6373971.1 GAF domain-containing protein [Robiginitalea sp. SP8]